MSIFKTIFGNSEEQNSESDNINWIPLTDNNQLNEIIANSANKPIVIFKHSTRCSISRMALKQLEREFDLKETIDTYFLDLLEYRNISNEISERFHVTHQSPQLILIKDGKAVYHASHSDIDADSLKTNV